MEKSRFEDITEQNGLKEIFEHDPFYYELMISKGKTGYVALCRYPPDQDREDILAIRHQRKSGLME